MTTMQQKFFRQLDAMVAALNAEEERRYAVAEHRRPLEVVISADWPNVGTLQVQPVSGFGPALSEARYNFQPGHATFTVNGQDYYGTFGVPRPGTTAVTLDAILDLIVAPARAGGAR